MPNESYCEKDSDIDEYLFFGKELIEELILSFDWSSFGKLAYLGELY